MMWVYWAAKVMKDDTRTAGIVPVSEWDTLKLMPA